MKRFLLVVGATALLSACGGREVHAPAAMGGLVKPGMTPWLTVAKNADNLEVRGLDHTLILEPSPALSVAMQSQLGAQLQPDYFPDLVVTCSALTAALRVDEDKAPGQMSMDLTLHCAVWARGFDANHDYKAHVSAAVAPSAGDMGYAQALPALLAGGAADIASQLRGDLSTLARAARPAH